MSDAKGGRSSLSPSRNFLYQFAAGVGWIWANILRPLLKPFRFLFGGLIRWYRRMWDRRVYGANGKFSTTRAGLVLTATVAAMFVILPVLGILFDATLFALTVREERLILTQSQDIYPDEDIHSVKGCDSQECTPEDSVYFRARDTWFNQIWSISTGRWLYYPEDVAAAVPPGMSDCTVLRYGFRFKTLMKHFGIYPDILDVRCSRLT